MNFVHLFFLFFEYLYNIDIIFNEKREIYGKNRGY